jgi:hypothetical protein
MTKKPQNQESQQSPLIHSLTTKITVPPSAPPIPFPLNQPSITVKGTTDPTTTAMLWQGPNGTTESVTITSGVNWSVTINSPADVPNVAGQYPSGMLILAGSGKPQNFSMPIVRA